MTAALPIETPFVRKSTVMTAGLSTSYEPERTCLEGVEIVTLETVGIASANAPIAATRTGKRQIDFMVGPSFSGRIWSSLGGFARQQSNSPTLLLRTSAGQTENSADSKIAY
jgi:hypothetical protein